MAKKRVKRQPKKLSVDVIEAQSITLVDEYGSERAKLACSGGEGGIGGFTYICLNDDEGHPKITLQVDDQGNPSIALYTRNNSSGVSMAVNDSHGNGLVIHGSDGKTHIMLGVPGPESNDPRGQTPDITVIDENGRKNWSAFEGTYEIPDT